MRQSDVPVVSRERYGWVDNAKGLGITLVVAGHAWRGLGNAGIVAEDAAFWFADRWVYAFHMPLFFFLSGLFLARSAGKGPARFFREKSVTLLYPFLLWSVLLVTMQVVLSARLNHRVTPADVPLLLLARPTLWFLPVLFLAAAVVFAVVRAGLGVTGIAVAFLGLWAAWAATTDLPVWRWSPLYFLAENGMYVALGAAAAHRLVGRPAQAPLGRPVPLALAAVTLAAALTGCVAARFDRSAWLGPVPACAGVAMAVALAMLLDRSGVTVVRRLGELSLPIYLASTFAMSGTRIALQHGLKFNDPATHLVLGTAAGLAFPVVLAVLATRLRVAALLFGAGPRTASAAAPAGTAPPPAPERAAVPAMPAPPPRVDVQVLLPGPFTIRTVRAQVSTWRRPPAPATTES